MKFKVSRINHFFPARVDAEGIHTDDRFSTCAKKVIKGLEISDLKYSNLSTFVRVREPRSEHKQLTVCLTIVIKGQPQAWTHLQSDPDLGTPSGERVLSTKSGCPLNRENCKTIFSLPGLMPKASTRMPFCKAKRHCRVRIRKRHFGILTNPVEGHFMSHYCQGQRYSRAHSDHLLLHQTRQWHGFRKCVARNVAVWRAIYHGSLSYQLHRAGKFSIMLEHNAINLVSKKIFTDSKHDSDVAGILLKISKKFHKKKLGKKYLVPKSGVPKSGSDCISKWQKNWV
eukprot:sb/3467792/